MGMRPEEMERWGVVSIFKESARLLHKHYRLFLPLVLAFYLSTSIARVFLTLFLFTSIVKGSVNSAQNTDPPGDQSFTTIFSWTLLLYLLIFIVETLGTGAVFYITDYLYTPRDDRSIFPKVLKFLPHAFLRMFITQLWAILAVLLVSLFSGILGGILNATMYLAAGWSDSILLLLFVLLPLLLGIIFLAIVFAVLAQVIAVLEPGNYGREALKRSTRLVRIGRAWTIVAVTLTGNVLSTVLTVPTNGIMTGGMPVWAKVVLGVFIGGLASVLRVYSEVASVVMYIVYKGRFDAAGSAGILVFQRIDSAEHSYDPIVEGKGLVNRRKLKTLELSAVITY